MTGLKAFLAKDVVKVILGAVILAANGLVVLYVKNADLKIQLLGWINGIGVLLGVTSGGTSGLRSNASNEQTAALQAKGVVPPPG